MSQRYAVAYRAGARALGFQKQPGEVIRPFRWQRSVPYKRPGPYPSPYSMPKEGYGMRAYGSGPDREWRAWHSAGSFFANPYIPEMVEVAKATRSPVLPGLSALYGLGLLFKWGPLSGPAWWAAKADYFDGFHKTVDHIAPDGVALHLQAAQGYVHEIQEGADGVRELHAAHIGDQTSTALAWPRETGAVTAFTAAAVCTEGVHWRTHSEWSSAIARVPAPRVRVFPQLVPPRTNPAWSPARWIEPMIMPVASPLVVIPRPWPLRAPRPGRNALGEAIRNPPAPPRALPPGRDVMSGKTFRAPKRPRKPGKKTKERKVLQSFAGARSVGFWIGMATESLDFVDAIWDALPAPNWMGSDRHIRPNITPNDKVRDIWERFDEIDWLEALGNIAEETAEDVAYGWVGRRMADAVRANPYYSSQVGYQAGSWLRPQVGL